ncbi:chromatin remodelling complex ATPase chain ISW1 [Scheffersomyces xylosifermentans]|uniref:chromatin remodelling complex ATPase chain ISW1 n=1 Tax=Scheffersomyces xylosifermentans TaxID=1304137 RepID=UPI00315C5682
MSETPEVTPSLDLNDLLESEEKSDSSVLDHNSNQAKYFIKSEKQIVDVEKTSHRFKYLLGLTSLFKHFIEAKANKDPLFRKIVDELNSTTTESNGDKASARRRKTEKEEDAELLNDEVATATITEFTESPRYVHGQLRPYQIQGLNWLISLYENNLSGILADEMGLGKTLQTISFIGYLRYIKHINGPHIVITPKSTLDNWKREFNRWIPDIKVLVIQGDKDERHDLIRDQVLTCKFDVIIASYEIVIREKSTFRKFDWEYIIIDEAHRIKNEESLLSQIIRMFHSKNRLLITGTPLQNNLRELWALLNFILPDVFADNESFDEWFQNDSNDAENEDTVVQQLHKVLKPFLLRRIKADVEKSLLPKQEMNVYIKMSDMQRKWYQKILEKDIDAVNGANKKESKTRLLNIVMQLRKCCNHPYLFEGAEPGPPFTTDEHLVFNSQKMVILDKLLKKFQREGSRVLIFSQMSRMLDILEDYCFFREFQYCRIDGQTEHADRINAIDEYNKPGSEKFVFLLTTRAGGLGINLTSADIVILFDSDWNPQADLQAMDRAHRIGQTKQVKVFRFITENAIEEKVLERATQKLRLDQLVIQQGRNSGGLDGQQSSKAASKNELLDMIQFGAADMFNNVEEDGNDVDVEEILKQSESKTKELNDKYSQLNLNALQHFTNDESVYEWNGENFKKKEPTAITNIGHAWINPGKRERKENYSIDMYYKDVLNTGGRSSSGGATKSGPRPPKQLNIYDHQFYPAKLFELYELEKNYYKKQIKYKVPLKAGEPGTEKERKIEQKLEQEEIDNSRPLTDEERSLKEELLTQGYSNWNRRDFTHFISVCTKYGRNSIPLIATEFEDKTLEEVREYAKAFWKNYEEIEGYERYINQIESGEEKILKIKLQKEALRRKLSQYKYPLQELVLKFPPATTNKRIFTEEEDRFLLVQLYRFGLDSPDLYERMKEAIRDSPLFQFDFFLQSRNTSELSRRCTTLLGCILKEIHPDLAPNTSNGTSSNGKRKREETPDVTEKKKKQQKKK